jgi:signal recognition particle receptor subunit beta
MPFVQHARRELHLKIVYYGPGLGGKTTNLEWIHAKTRPELRGKLISLATETERTLFFDLLPVELGKFRGYDIRLHLCTVPGQIAQEQTRRLVLRHVDGIVFVVDSQPSRLEDNVESIRNLETNLMMQGDDPDLLPMVVQYNKRDLPTATSIDELRESLSIPSGTPEIEGQALEGVGVFDTLKAIVRGCLALVGDPATLADGRSPSVLPGRRASMYPGGRPEAATTTPAEGEESPAVPKAPRMPTDAEDTEEA